MLEQSALAAAASAHDDENVFMSDGEGEIALDDETALRHFMAMRLVKARESIG